MDQDLQSIQFRWIRFFETFSWQEILTLPPILSFLTESQGSSQVMVLLLYLYAVLGVSLFAKALSFYSSPCSFAVQKQYFNRALQVAYTDVGIYGPLIADIHSSTNRPFVGQCVTGPQANFRTFFQAACVLPQTVCLHLGFLR